MSRASRQIYSDPETGGRCRRGPGAETAELLTECGGRTRVVVGTRIPYDSGTAVMDRTTLCNRRHLKLPFLGKTKWTESSGSSMLPGGIPVRVPWSDLEFQRGGRYHKRRWAGDYGFAGARINPSSISLDDDAGTGIVASPSSSASPVAALQTKISSYASEKVSESHTQRRTFDPSVLWLRHAAVPTVPFSTPWTY